MIRYNMNTINFELVKVFGKPALFTGARITFATVEEPLHMYEVQHAPAVSFRPVSIAKEVRKYFFGTIITLDKIDFDSTPKPISKDDIEYTGRIMNSSEFLNEFYLEKKEER